MVIWLISESAVLGPTSRKKSSFMEANILIYEVTATSKDATPTIYVLTFSIPYLGI